MISTISPYKFSTVILPPCANANGTISLRGTEIIQQIIQQMLQNKCAGI